MSTWAQALLTILVSALSGITINFTFRQGERAHARHTAKKTSAAALNGYAPILEKALDRIDHYQAENERLRQRLAECQAQRRKTRARTPSDRPSTRHSESSRP